MNQKQHLSDMGKAMARARWDRLDTEQRRAATAPGRAKLAKIRKAKPKKEKKP